MKKFNLFLMAIMVAVTLTLTGCGRSKDTLEADACPLVEEIFEKNGLDVSCDRLLDIKKIDNDHYTATAEVSDGEDTELFDISINYDDDMVIVKIED